jgi:hypothetical protein
MFCECYAGFVVSATEPFRPGRSLSASAHRRPASRMETAARTSAPPDAVVAHVALVPTVQKVTYPRDDLGPVELDVRHQIPMG